MLIYVSMPPKKRATLTSPKKSAKSASLKRKCALCDVVETVTNPVNPSLVKGTVEAKLRALASLRTVPLGKKIRNHSPKFCTACRDPFGEYLKSIAAVEAADKERLMHQNTCLALAGVNVDARADDLVCIDKNVMIMVPNDAGGVLAACQSANRDDLGAAFAKLSADYNGKVKDQLLKDAVAKRLNADIKQLCKHFLPDPNDADKTMPNPLLFAANAAEAAESLSKGLSSMFQDIMAYWTAHGDFFLWILRLQSYWQHAYNVPHKRVRSKIRPVRSTTSTDTSGACARGQPVTQWSATHTL